jgi:hypothetical protein
MSRRRLSRRRLAWAVWLAARLMPLRIAGMEMGPLLAAYDPGPATGRCELPPSEIVALVQRMTRHPWTMRNRRCLRQGLLAFRYLTLAGYRPELHFAIDRASLSAARPMAHCWIELDGRPMLNPPSPTMVTLFVYRGRQSFAGGGSLPGVLHGKAAKIRLSA